MRRPAKRDGGKAGSLGAIIREDKTRAARSKTCEFSECRKKLPSSNVRFCSGQCRAANAREKRVSVRSRLVTKGSPKQLHALNNWTVSKTSLAGKKCPKHRKETVDACGCCEECFREASAVLFHDDTRDEVVRGVRKY